MLNITKKNMMTIKTVEHDKKSLKGEFRFVKLFFQNWYILKVNIIKKRKNEKKLFFGFLKLVFRVIYFARSLLKAIKYDVLVALIYWVLSFCMDVSYSSDEENLNVQSSDDLDIEVESFTGYGNEPEYTEQEISK